MCRRTQKRLTYWPKPYPSRYLLFLPVAKQGLPVRRRQASLALACERRAELLKLLATGTDDIAELKAEKAAAENSFQGQFAGRDRPR